VPERYEAIRDSPSMRRKYRTLALRKKHAAMIFNATRKKGEPPVTGAVEPKPEGQHGTKEPKGQVGSRR